MNLVIRSILSLVFVAGTVLIQGQDLDPRAYTRAPVNGTVVITGFQYSKGAVVTDPSIALQNLKASLQIPSLAVARSFGFLRKTSQFLVAVPYAWGQASATVNGTPESVNRNGFSDLRLRWSVLFKGAPAMSIQQLAKAPHKTILGASINVVIPTGQYYRERLINLGTNRWAFRPELAISHPFSKRWMIDGYAGIWLFTPNSSFYPGNTRKTQNPMGSFQAHLSYNVSLKAWVAFDLTYYVGGNSEINGKPNNDRQSNSRVGATLVFPTGKWSALKLAASTGAIVRSGANFTTLSVGWQRAFYNMKQKPMK